MRKIKLGIYLDSVNKKKDQVHYVNRLNSGKEVHLWLWSSPITYENSIHFHRRWDVGLYVSRSGGKEARRWAYGDEEIEEITGDGSLEALIWAYRKLEWFREHIPQQDKVVVRWADSKRQSAYRMLERRGWDLSWWDYYYSYGKLK